MEIRLKCTDYSVKPQINSIIKNFFDFKIGSALTELIKIEETNEMLAFLLLFNSAKETNLQLSKELGQDILDSTIDLVAIKNGIESEIIEFFEQDITITKAFFDDVIKSNTEYLSKSFLLFRKYLALLKISVPENYEYIYYRTFRKNLSNEFQNNKESYKRLVEFFENPFFNENSKFDKQIEYYQKIKCLFTNPLQPDIEESLETLKDLYIEPYFKFYKNNISYKPKKINDFIQPKNKTLSIHSFLNDYFLKGKKHDDCSCNFNMLFLLGQPGQGKTSFCYKLIYDYLEANNGLPEIPIYFIKIRDLVAKDFIDSTFNTLNNHLKQDIKFEEDNCILLLDGLDEAYMGGGISDNDLKTLYERLNKIAQQNNKLKIILTSRLNYLKVNDPCLDKSLVIELSELTDNQILEYTAKFKKFYPKNKFVKKVKSILKEKKFIHIKELLQQAVLIYFIATSDIDIEEKDSKSKIYDKIFNSLSKRSWDRNGQFNYIKPKVKDNLLIYEKYLREYIRNIAFEIYQSPDLYITLDKLINLDATKTFVKKCFDDDLINTPEKIKEVNKYLLISFYFQESSNNQTTDTAIEFFHNSLWEFLTAEYFWEQNKKLLLKKDDDGDFLTVSNEQYFELLNRLIGQKKMSDSVRENLENIIDNEYLDIKNNIVQQSNKLFYSLAEDDFLLNYNRKDNQLTSIEKVISIFELFWTLLHRSNLLNEQQIITNNSISIYLFKYSHLFRYRYPFQNVYFDDVFLFYISIGECSFINCSFIDCLSFNCHMYKCMFINTEISCSFNESKLEECFFSKTLFDDCYFNDSIIVDNHFEICKFNNVKIPDKEWFNQLCSNNFVDVYTKNNHQIVEKTSKLNGDLEYYIVFKEEMQ